MKLTERYLIASGKGGVGKSTFTVGIAKALAGRGKTVLMIDTDIGLRSLDLLTEGSEAIVFDWGDIINGRCECEEAVLKNGNTGLLTCPVSFGAEYTPKHFAQLVDLLDNGEYDFILIDAPAGIGEVLTMACAASEKAVVIATPDNVCVRSACAAANVIAERGVEDVRLVINRFREKEIHRGKLLNIDSVIDATQVQLLGIIPEDAGLSCGKIGKKRQISTQAFRRIAARMCGESVPLFD